MEDVLDVSVNIFIHIQTYAHMAYKLIDILTVSFKSSYKYLQVICYHARLIYQITQIGLIPMKTDRGTQIPTDRTM